jgi:hypothetical protein
MTTLGPWAEVGLALVMVIGTGYTLWSRLRDKAQPPRGVGARVIQLIALLVILPLVGILALEGKLSGDTAGALIGVAIGYTLSGIERAVPSNQKNGGRSAEP